MHVLQPTSRQIKGFMLSDQSLNSIVSKWDKLSAFPGGKLLFSLVIGWVAPYSGSIRARIDALSEGFAQVSMRDRRRVRNHLQSIHAIALINLGEIATGLALLSTLPDNMRGIVLGLQTEYVKKARGKLTAKAYFSLPSSVANDTRCEVTTDIADSSGETVAIVRASWLIGYKK